MKNFKKGDKVRIISEPMFITNRNNKICKMHLPKEREPGDDPLLSNIMSTIGRADMTHLIGVEAEVESQVEYPFTGKADLYRLSWPDGVDVPTGLAVEGVRGENLEKV